MKEILVRLGEKSYTVTIGHGLLKSLRSLLPLAGRQVMIVTDSGVPRAYAEAVSAAADRAVIYTVPSGEDSKSFSCYEEILAAMLENGFTRSDCVCAVGGGVVGDLAGFVAASYMRGVDFYNIPTTMLAMVDSSVGGKTALNLRGVKNIVGAFYQPRAVIVDCDVLATLPARQLSAGLSEAVKMALTSDAELFSLFEAESLPSHEETVARSVAIKARIVEEDEREGGVRRLLNFGHTLGHAVEAYEQLGGLLHGECVALGMLPMCSRGVRERLLPVLRRLSLPTRLPTDTEAIFSYLAYDKKREGECVHAVLVDSVGEGRIESMSLSSLKERICDYLAKEESK